MLGLHKSASNIPALKSGIPPRMHPLAAEGFRRYAKTKKLTKDDFKALREGLADYAGDPKGMWAAISSLGLLAVVVERDGDQEAGQQLRKLIASGGQHVAPIAAEIAKSLGLDPAGGTERARQAHERWLATPTDHRAPVYDAPKPQNTLHLYQVDFAMVTARFRELRLSGEPNEWRPRLPRRGKRRLTEADSDGRL